MASPLTTPCAHNFCKACLEGAFSGQSFIRNRACGGGRTLRAQKNVMKCPSCSNDIADFLQNPQVLRNAVIGFYSCTKYASALIWISFNCIPNLLGNAYAYTLMASFCIK